MEEIFVQPFAQSAVLPCYFSFTCIILLTVQAILANDKQPVILFGKHKPFNIFFAVGCLVILLIGAKENGIAYSRFRQKRSAILRLNAFLLFLAVFILHAVQKFPCRFVVLRSYTLHCTIVFACCNGFRIAGLSQQAVGFFVLFLTEQHFRPVSLTLRNVLLLTNFVKKPVGLVIFLLG